MNIYGEKMTVQPTQPTQPNYHSPPPKQKSGCGLISVLAIGILSLFSGIAIGAGTLAFVASRNAEVSTAIGATTEHHIPPQADAPVEKKKDAPKYGLIYPVEDSLRIDGSLTKPEVANVITEKRYDLRECYSTALKKDEDLKGEMFIQFRVAKGSGNALAAIVRKSTIKDKVLLDCVVNKINKWKFPGQKKLDSSIKLDVLLAPI